MLLLMATVVIGAVMMAGCSGKDSKDETKEVTIGVQDTDRKSVV